jgi:hypothetical protein
MLESRANTARYSRDSSRGFEPLRSRSAIGELIQLGTEQNEVSSGNPNVVVTFKQDQTLALASRPACLDGVTIREAKPQAAPDPNFTLLELKARFTQLQVLGGVRVPPTVLGWLAQYETPDAAENWLISKAQAALVIDLAGHGPGHYRIAVFWGQRFPSAAPGLPMCGSCKCGCHRAYFVLPPNPYEGDCDDVADVTGVGGQPLCAVPLRFDSEDAANNWSDQPASKAWLAGVGLIVPLMLA